MDTINTSQLCCLEQNNFKEESQREFNHKLSESEALHKSLPNLNSEFEYDPIGAEIIFDDINSKNSKNAISTENIILDLFKKDHLMDFEEKINLARIVLSYFTNFGFFEEFFEEECHLAMVNWVYKNKKFLEIENEFRLQSNELLNIILNIFEILPIKVEELFTLNIYEKLNKFRKIMKNKNFIIYQKLDRLLCYWSQFCIEEIYLTKKRERIEKEDEEIKEIECMNKKKVSLNSKSIKIFFKQNYFSRIRNSLIVYIKFIFFINFLIIQQFYDQNINLNQKNKKEILEIDYLKYNYNIQNIRKSYDKSSVYGSGVLKSSSTNKKENKTKKSVNWKTEEEINQINIFKYYDPPSSGAITQEEYESINSFIIETRKKNSN